jgi:hypothetical protein
MQINHFSSGISSRSLITRRENNNAKLKQCAMRSLNSSSVYTMQQILNSKMAYAAIGLLSH